MKINNEFRFTFVQLLFATNFFDAVYTIVMVNTVNMDVKLNQLHTNEYSVVRIEEEKPNQQNKRLTFEETKSIDYLQSHLVYLMIQLKLVSVRNQLAKEKNIRV